MKTMNKEKVIELLYQQLQLLAEESKKSKPNDRGYKPGLVEYSDAIDRIACTLREFFDN